MAKVIVSIKMLNKFKIVQKKKKNPSKRNKRKTTPRQLIGVIKILKTSDKEENLKTPEKKYVYILHTEEQKQWH